MINNLDELEYTLDWLEKKAKRLKRKQEQALDRGSAKDAAMYQQKKRHAYTAIKCINEVIKNREGTNEHINKKAFTPVICVTAGNGYEEGTLYPLIGWNNGVHILRTDENGDVVDIVFCSGGYGKGNFNPFDDSGAPSFKLL